MSDSERYSYKEMNLLEFQEKFPDEKACWTHLVCMRWPESWRCPRCEESAFCVLEGRKCLQCNRCKHQVFPMAGTIFHRAYLPIRSDEGKGVDNQGFLN